MSTNTVDGPVYRGSFAQWYDLFYGDKPYAQEAAFIHHLLAKHSRRAGKRLLDLACGTGKHSLLLSQLGYQVTAVDLSDDMLAQARANARKAQIDVEFQQQDMRSLDVGTASFDVVISLFDSLGYVLTNDALLETLRRIQRTLSDDGLFLAEFWHAPAMQRHFDPVRVRRWPIPEGQILRISETSLDYASQMSRVQYSVHRLRQDGTYEVWCEEHRNRFFSLPEMAGWLTRCGLQPLEFLAGFNESRAIDDDTWHVLVLARKIAESVAE